MLEAVRILATVADYTEKQLNDIAREFGHDQLIPCEIPVGVLIRACGEHANLADPQDATVTCARIVVLAEQLVNYTGVQESSHFQGMILTLRREIDNLRGYSREPQCAVVNIKALPLSGAA